MNNSDRALINERVDTIVGLARAARLQIDKGNLIEAVATLNKVEDFAYAAQRFLEVA